MTQETVFACDALGDLYQYNEQLLWANKELLARCDLLGAELAALVEAARPVVEDWMATRPKVVDSEGYVIILCAEQLDALAALVGEE